MTDPTPLRPTDNEPIEAVVEELRDLLAMAERGELLGFIICGRVSGASFYRVTVGELDRTHVISTCEIIKHSAMHDFGLHGE